MTTTKRQPDAKAPDDQPVGSTPEGPDENRRPVEYIAVQQRRERVRGKLQKFH